MAFLVHTAIVLILCTCVGFAQHGVGPLWGPEIPLPLVNPGASQRGVLFNNMAVSSRGRVFVATVEADPTTQVTIGNYLTFLDSATNWHSPVPITPMTLVVGGSSPKLAMDAADNLFVLFSSRNPAALYLVRYDTSLTLRSDTIRVASPTLYPTFASTHLTVDGRNRLHVIWHEGNMEAGEIVESFTCRSTNGGLTWSAPIRLSDLDGRHSAFPRGQFDVANGDTLAIAWRDSSAVPQNKWDVLMSVSTDGGVSWRAPQQVAASVHYESDPDIVIDTQNRIHLFYHQYPAGNPFWGANIRYRWSDNLGASWSTEQQLSEAGGTIRSHLNEGNRYDPVRNVLWCMWKDERDFFNGQDRSDIVISYSTDRGLSWSVPEFVTDWDTLSVAFKAATLFPDGAYCTNYEVIISTSPMTRRVYYRRRSGVTAVIDPKATPSEHVLLWNYPNPFNPSTTITVVLPERTNASLKIVDMLGREIRTYDLGNALAGTYTVTWDGSTTSGAQAASGVYFAQLTTASLTRTRKMMLVR